MSNALVLDRGPSHALTHKMRTQPNNFIYEGKHEHSDNREKLKKFVEFCGILKTTPGVHTYTIMKAAGLDYTGQGDTARCQKCGWEQSGWTHEMHPFKLHAEKNPNCSYVLSLKTSSILQSSTFIAHTSNSDSSSLKANESSISTSDDGEIRAKRQKLDTSADFLFLNHWNEAKPLDQARRRTFSHWPHRTSPSTSQMIEAGFFSCNVGDRVICIYCNLICQQWTPNGDDACEVHKTLSPSCIFVKAKLLRRDTGSILIVNEASTASATANDASSSDRNQAFRGQSLVHTVACHPIYAELPRRHTSFNSWPMENLPSVDDLVRAGFFYSGTKTVVTCFYCNGSLQNWGPKDNPMIEHARWFPHCAYAKQLCGEDLYRKIQESKRAQQERLKAEEMRRSNGVNSSPSGSSSGLKLQIPDENTLSRLVAARLDLPISQTLLGDNFKLSIIKRCWEDQLRLKHDDFSSDCDLRMACVILQKQITHIDGKKENIKIPSVEMKKIRQQNERESLAAAAHEQNLSTATSSSANNPPQASCTTAAKKETEPSTTSQSDTNESSSSMESTSPCTTQRADENVKNIPDPNSKKSEKTSPPDSTLSNPCVICMQEEKGLACIPCGHLATCVPCGHSLRSCPLCRREIEAFVRVYV